VIKNLLYVTRLLKISTIQQNRTEGIEELNTYHHKITRHVYGCSLISTQPIWFLGRKKTAVIYSSLHHKLLRIRPSQVTNSPPAFRLTYPNFLHSMGNMELYVVYTHNVCGRNDTQLRAQTQWSSIDKYYQKLLFALTRVWYVVIMRIMCNYVITTHRGQLCSYYTFTHHHGITYYAGKLKIDMAIFNPNITENRRK